MPSPADASFAKVEALKQFGRIPENPPVDGRMIDRDTTLGHHLFQVPEAEIVSQIPADTEQDHGSIKMTAFEHLNLQSSLEA
jgi:hypothetical protein